MLGWGQQSITSGREPAREEESPKGVVSMLRSKVAEEGDIVRTPNFVGSELSTPRFVVVARATGLVLV